MRRSVILTLALLPIIGTRLTAQCKVPANSNEAKLLAFYSVPIAFSPAGAPEHPEPWTLRLGAEAGPIFDPDSAIQQSSACFTKKSENTGLSPLFGRPRLTLTLSHGFAIEASYLPPVKIGDAKPNLASGAISWTKRIRMAPTGNATDIMLRAHGTYGQVRGPITCPDKALQQTDASRPCYGSNPSSDTFRPNMFGFEGVVSTAAWDGRLAFYAGGGPNFLQPRFRVGFTDRLGNVDHTLIEVDLTRFAMFGGLTAEVSNAIDISAQAYGVREDGVTFKIGGGYRIR